MDPKPTRRPGELAFTIFLAAASLGLLWSAYGIAGFEALSSPGAVPMATTAIMVVSALVVLVETLRRPTGRIQTLRRDILPPAVIVTIAMIALYALLLRPLGFIPTSLLFLTAMIWFLSRRGLLFCLGVAFGTVLLIWLIFRMVFSVLMPPGIVPEGRIVAFLMSLF